MTGLEQLWLGKNKITELKNLDALTNLKILSIQSNRLTKIDGLSKLKNLEELYVSHNAIEEISGLEENTNLNVIDISSNPIKQLKGLKTLEHLQEFWASNCQLSSFEEIEKELADKKELETVYFEGNPLQKAQPVLYRNKVRLALPQIRQIDASKLPCIQHKHAILNTTSFRAGDRTIAGPAPMDTLLGRVRSTMGRFWSRTTPVSSWTRT